MLNQTHILLICIALRFHDLIPTLLKRTYCPKMTILACINPTQNLKLDLRNDIISLCCIPLSFWLKTADPAKRNSRAPASKASIRLQH